MPTPPSVRIPADVLSRDVQGEAVILQLESGEYFGLDPVGTRVWQSVAEGLDLPAVIERICGEFDVAPATAASDVRELVDDLLRRGLLEPGTAER